MTSHSRNSSSKTKAKQNAKHGAISSISVSAMGERRRDTMLATTEAVLEDLVQNSAFFQSSDGCRPRPIPAFDQKEVVVGAICGYGEFGVVSEVVKLCLDKSHVNHESPLARQALPQNNDDAHPALAPPSPRLSVPKSIQIPSDNTTTAPFPKRPELILPQRGEHKRSRSVSFAGNTKEPANVASSVDGTTENTRTTTTCGTAGDELHSHHHEDDEDDDDDSMAEAKNTTRISMAAHTHRKGHARYAIKRLKKELPGDKEIQLAAALDLACEAMFLQSLNHTNIIHLRGTVGVPGTPDFAILLDRLMLTLEEKLQQWQSLKKQYRGHYFGLFGRKAQSLASLETERLLVSFDVSRAMLHLHNRKIIYRDLKPENLGFNVRGEVKLFDFGLAKELKPIDLAEGETDKYEATGLTGSRRYEAPEVIRCLPYGFKADVFSFSILLWQICALRVPFEKMNANEHFDHVVVKKKRPSVRLLPELPTQIRVMLEECWSDDPDKRPTFRQISQILQVALSGGSGGEGSSEIIDRSTHLLDRSRRSMRLLTSGPPSTANSIPSITDDGD